MDPVVSRAIYRAYGGRSLTRTKKIDQPSVRNRVLFQTRNAIRGYESERFMITGMC